MFSLFNRKSKKFGKSDTEVTESQSGTHTVTIQLDGMHCSSCSLNIDGALEDTPGVVSASTSYAKSQTEVTFDPVKVKLEKLHEVIRELGYQTK